MIQLKKDKKHGYYHKLWLYLLIAILPIIFVAGLVISSYIIRAQYNDFDKMLLTSFSYGIDNNSLRAEYLGESTKINQENAESIHNEIHLSRYRFYKEEIESNPNIIFEFGNGDRLLLYRIDKETMLFHHIKHDGDENVLVSTQITRLITYERLISVEWENTIWQ